ncbi:hypothetical protein TRFO_05006 [Tritrichomonas foetus]|uniref:Initiator binding domain-containing protein n=1 Tax=Tritrichomonas foetus TaxID=1144522 RepID=A0A1J4KE46_9EUKA|nr:hypothetical protein TRFO_05006 [Tritrichomonas foetus]|eukprot:OHT07902.1 hypothetical protein TRFO_05006 [Tritrichomonas foetus]
MNICKLFNFEIYSTQKLHQIILKKIFSPMISSLSLFLHPENQTPSHQQASQQANQQKPTQTISVRTHRIPKNKSHPYDNKILNEINKTTIPLCQSKSNTIISQHDQNMPNISHNNLNLSSSNLPLNYNDENDEEEGNLNLGMSFSSSRRVTNSSPMFSIKVKPISAMTFEEACTDPHLVINPSKMGFIPSSIWSNDTISFGFLVTTFFRKRNSATSKFPHKLYNALRLSECFSDFKNLLGISWITNDIFRVDRNAFARLIGVKSVEGGLFHQQGNFPSHGFEELDFQESEKISMEYGLGHADLSTVRFIRNSHGNFNKYSTESEMENLKWSAKPQSSESV